MSRDEWGLGKRTYYPNMRPIAPDIGLPEPTKMVESIGQKHLLVQTVTTGAVEMFKDDGGDYRYGVILELEGRFNRTETPGHHKVILDLDAAVILYKNLQHSLGVILAMKEDDD